LTLKTPVFSDTFVYLPLDGCSSIVHDLIMTSKMKLSNVEYHKDWVDWVLIKRNHEKEDKLFNELGLTTDSKYVFVRHIAKIR
jgi:hypothetical protein